MIKNVPRQTGRVICDLYSLAMHGTHTRIGEIGRKLSFQQRDQPREERTLGTRLQRDCHLCKNLKSSGVKKIFCKKQKVGWTKDKFMRLMFVLFVFRVCQMCLKRSEAMKTCLKTILHLHFEISKVQNRLRGCSC